MTILGISTCPGHVVYTRWGKNVCPENATRVYKGEVTSGASTLSGGSQYLCLPSESLEWLPYDTSVPGKFEV